MQTPSQKSLRSDRAMTLARIFLAAIFFFAAGVFSFRVLFPSQPFSFDFRNPKASKNSLLDPHGASGQSLGKGEIHQNTSLILDAAILQGNDSSDTAVEFSLEKSSDQKRIEGSVSVRKSYRAAFFPEGEPILQLPAIVQEGILHSGSLVSFADGVFLIDGESIRPIGDALIFESLGYHWDDVSPLGEEEMGIYQKGKMVLLGNTHPDGTIFFAEDTGRFFLIEKGMRRPIPDPALARALLGHTHPIVFSENALAKERSCQLSLSGWFTRKLHCLIAVSEFKNLPGDSYRFKSHFDSAVSLQNASIVFSNAISFDTLQASLSTIKQRIFSHYGYAQ